MIPKAQLLNLAKQQELLPTTVEKDYVLGWLLYAIAKNEPTIPVGIQGRYLPQEVLL